MEPTVGRGEDGSIFILDNGWAASFKDGEWTERLLFSHNQISEFSPVKDRAEIYRILGEAHDALRKKPRE
jgi:hypothetical protein